MSEPEKISNNLKAIRKKQGLLQKQIAFLLKQSTSDQISRYERGIQLPNLKTTFKLGLVYQTPLNVLFDGAFENCREELKKAGFEIKNTGFKNLLNDQISVKPGKENTRNLHQCGFKNLLESSTVKKTDLDDVRGHISELVRLRMEKMDHI